MRKDKTYDIQDIVHAQSDAVTLSDLIFAPEASGLGHESHDFLHLELPVTTIVPSNSRD